MAMDYRSIILCRLKARDKHCEQFSRVFYSFDLLSKSLNHLLDKSAGSTRRQCSLIEIESDEELNNLKTELSDLYKKKAINDQQLIDANRQLKEKEEEVESILNERDLTLKLIEEAKSQCLQEEKNVAALKEANHLLHNEFSATQALYNSISQKYITENQKCIEFVDQIKEMKMQEVLMLNEFNELVEKRRIDKICKDIEEATKPSTALDIYLSNASDPDKDRPSSVGSDDTFLDFLGDVIPKKCCFKVEADELGEINHCIFHPNGRFFFTGGNDKRVKMFELYGKSCGNKVFFEGANQSITQVDIDADNQFLAASSYDKTIRLWNINDRRLKVTFTGHSDKVGAAKFFGSGRFIFSGSNDRSVKIFDITSNRCTRTYFPGSLVLDVATNDRFGASLISSHYDKSIRFWDPLSSSSTNAFKLGGKLTSLFVSPDGLSLLCSCRDETLSLIDLRNNGIIHIYSAEQYRTASDNCKCVLSPCGTYVASGSADGHIFVWNTMTTRLEKVLYKNSHENVPILSLAWHPRGHIIVSGDKRKTVCLWS